MPMLGKGIMFLISIIMLASFVPGIYAEENSELIIVETDKEEYHSGDELTILGAVIEKKMPIIAMRVYDPDDSIISANNLEIEKDDTFSKTIFLDGPFYEKSGSYKILFDYGKEKTHIEFVISDKNDQELEIIEVQIPEIMLLTTDKTEYFDTEFVTITGTVSKISAPTVLVGLYDPFGFPAGFYFGEIDSNLDFTTSFLIKDGVNFKTFGTYSAIAYYEESEISVDFKYVEQNETIQVVVVEDEETDKELDNKQETSSTVEEKIDNEPIKDNDSEIISEELTTFVEIDPEENNKTKESKTDSENIVLHKKINDESKILVEENNLSVEDIALGIMLNQITLSCDDGEFVDSISYYDGMGPALMRLCNFNEAITHFDLALIDEPKNVQILTNKGSALNKLGFHDEAISFFDHALEIDPNFLPAINNKANTLVNLEKTQDAIKNYNLVLSLDPQFTLAKQNLDTVQKRFPTNLELSISEASNDLQLNSINHITNKVADSTVHAVNQINENPSNVFDQIGVVFSMIGTSFFSFLN